MNITSQGQILYNRLKVLSKNGSLIIDRAELHTFDNFYGEYILPTTSIYILSNDENKDSEILTTKLLFLFQNINLRLVLNHKSSFWIMCHTQLDPAIIRYCEEDIDLNSYLTEARSLSIVNNIITDYNPTNKIKVELNNPNTDRIPFKVGNEILKNHINSEDINCHLSPFFNFITELPIYAPWIFVNHPYPECRYTEFNADTSLFSDLTDYRISLVNSNVFYNYSNNYNNTGKNERVKIEGNQRGQSYEEDTPYSAKKWTIGIKDGHPEYYYLRSPSDLVDITKYKITTYLTKSTQTIYHNLFNSTYIQPIYSVKNVNNNIEINYPNLCSDVTIFSCEWDTRLYNYYYKEPTDPDILNYIRDFYLNAFDFEWINFTLEERVQANICLFPFEIDHAQGGNEQPCVFERLRHLYYVNNKRPPDLRKIYFMIFDVVFRLFPRNFNRNINLDIENLIKFRIRLKETPHRYRSNWVYFSLEYKGDYVN